MRKHAHYIVNGTNILNTYQEIVKKYFVTFLVFLVGEGVMTKELFDWFHFPCLLYIICTNIM